MLSSVLLSAALFLTPAPAAPCCGPDAVCCKAKLACCDTTAVLTAAEGEKKEGGCDSCKEGDKSKGADKSKDKAKEKETDKPKEKAPN